MSNNIKIKRGLKAGLPNLEVGEFGLATDTNEVFIGTPTGNELVNSNDYNDLTNKLTAGDNITIDANNKISVSGLEKHDIVLISDTAFTITQAHLNKTLIITSSDDVTITVPTKIVENIEKGFFCDIIRYGTGEVAFSGAGIVLNSAGPLSIDAQYIAASLIKIDDNNEWLLIGGRE